MTVVSTLDVTDRPPDRATAIAVTPLHNLFAPRLAELSGLVSSLPGAPKR